MQTTTTQPGLNTLETAVLECVAYSDLFDFPLTPDEVQRWLRVPATPDDVVAALDSLTLRPMLSRSGAYVTLAGRESLAQVRDRRRASSAALRGAADGYGSVIARLPFVRMVRGVIRQPASIDPGPTFRDRAKKTGRAGWLLRNESEGSAMPVFCRVVRSVAVMSQLHEYCKCLSSAIAKVSPRDLEGASFGMLPNSR